MNTWQPLGDYLVTTCYMLESEDRLVVDMRRRWEELEVWESWESYWKRMANNAVLVEEPFLYATAWFLNRDIWIVWDTATPASPLTFFSGDKEGNDTACPGVPLIIGHHTDTHYQSLLPEGDHVSNSFDTSKFAVDLTQTLEKVWEVFQRESRAKRKDPPAGSDRAQEGETEISILNYGSGNPGVEAKKMQDGGVQFQCLLCKTEQKQIRSHMKKKHADMFDKEELEEFQSSLKRFAQAAADVKMTRKRRVRDPEGLKKSISRSLQKRRLDDPDAEKANNKRKGARWVAKQKVENLEKFKNTRKGYKETERSNGPKKYKGETKLGPVFPCVCCRTYKFRHQSVLFNKEQAVKIDQKAEEIHQTIQVG